VRILLIAHNAYIEPTSGAARSVRTIMEWLHDGGHECHAVTSGCFDQIPGPPIEGQLAAMGIAVRRDSDGGPRPVFRYRLNGVAVTAVETRHVTRDVEDEAGNRQFAAEIVSALGEAPDVVFAYGRHALVHEGLKLAKAQGARTIYTVRGWGYEERCWFESASRVLLNCHYATRVFARQPGIYAEWLPSPFNWSEIRAPVESRGFVTFVNPALHKGFVLFARLADMLGRLRPDIPLLVVQSFPELSAFANLRVWTSRVMGISLSVRRYPSHGKYTR
jgi:hypothetical protein